MSAPKQVIPVTLRINITPISRNPPESSPVIIPVTARVTRISPSPSIIVKPTVRPAIIIPPPQSVNIVSSVRPTVVPVIQPRIQPRTLSTVQSVQRVHSTLPEVGYLSTTAPGLKLPIIRPIIQPILGPIQPIARVSLPVVRPIGSISGSSTDNEIEVERKYGYLLTFRKPEGDPVHLRAMILKLTSKARNELMTSCSVKSIDNLLALEEWTVPVNDNGTKLLIHFYLAYPDWDGWTPSSNAPVSMEGIFFLTCHNLRRFTRRLYPRAERHHRKKLPLFHQLISRMVQDNYIFASEAELYGDELIESLELNKQDILRELPSHSGLKRCNRIRLSFKHVVFLREIGKRKVDPIKLIEMGHSGWLRLATEEQIVGSSGSFAFSNLILSLTKSRRLDPKYCFMQETEFWTFYQKYYELLPKLASIYSEESIESKAAAALLLFEEGILDRDLQPKRLALLKKIESIDDIPKRINQYRIPGSENFPTPRRILTSKSILAGSNNAEDSTNSSNTITRKTLTKYIRETDLMFYDAVNPYPHLTIERSATHGGSSYLQNWQRPSGTTPYHYLTSSQIEGIMTARSITIPGNLEGRRLALAGLDQGDSTWKLEVLAVRRSEDLTVHQTHYLAGHHRINLLNDRYPETLIGIAISLKQKGIGGPNVENSPKAIIAKTEGVPKHRPDNQPVIPGKPEPPSEKEIIAGTIKTRAVKVIKVLPKESSWKTIQEAEQELTNLVKYPICLDTSLYLKIRKIGRTRLMLLIEILFEGNIEAILRPKDQHLFLMSRGYALSPVDQGIVQRHTTFSNLESNKRDLLLNFHGYPNNRLCLAKLSLETSNPIDTHIIQNDPAGLIKLLGIVVPGGVSDEDYLRDNIHLCKCIADRPPGTRLPTISDLATLSLGNLAKIKDQEMIEALGVRPVFTNRMDLINRLRQLWHEPGFFESIGRNCVNKETTLLSKTSDKTEIMIGYGCLDKYICYEIMELHGSFYLGDNQKVNFRKPDVKANFEFDEIIGLDELVQDLFIRTVGNPDRLAELHGRISQGIADHREMDRETRETYRNVARLSRTGKEQLRNWLRTLFDAGMYMRRWAGPGNPYPHTREETRGGSDPAVADQLSPLGRKIGLLQEMYYTFPESIRSIISRFTKVRYNQDESRYQIREGSIISLFRRVANGRECIRMASKHLVMSAAYYLYTFFHVRIDGFRPADVIAIS